MPSIQVTESDLQMAQDQIKLLEDLVSDYKSRSGDHTNTIEDLMLKIKQIRDESRRYDYLLNPRPAPEICTLCNGHKYVKMPTKPCPWCGCTLINAQPAEGMVHWKVPGDAVGKELAEGQVPA